MNLYRNFGSMLETWVAATDPEQSNDDADIAEGNGPALSADGERTEGPGIGEVPVVIQRLASEDSGFETENAPSTPGSLHGGFAPARGPEGREADGAGQDGHWPPIRSSRSFSCCSLFPTSPDPAMPSVSVEQALRRAARTGPRGPPSAGASPPPTTRPHLRPGPYSRCHSLNIPSGSGHRSEGDRTEGPRLRKAALPLIPSQQAPEPAEPIPSQQAPEPAEPIPSQQAPEPAEPCLVPAGPQPTSPQPYLGTDETDSPARCEEEASLRQDLPPGQGLPPGSGLWPCLGLSPGLGYLELVCRMLEEIARLQLRNQELQRENERRSLFDQHLSICAENPVDAGQSLHTEGGEELSGHTSPEDQLQPPRVRQRFMSNPLELISSQGEMDRLRQIYWGNMAKRDECDSRAPSGLEDARLKAGCPNRVSSLQEPDWQPAVSFGRNAPKKFGLLFKKRRKNTSAS